MRFYQNFSEAYPEIQRDLVKFGVLRHSNTQQDKYVGDNPDYQTKRLQVYSFGVMDPLVDTLECSKDPEWCLLELHERINTLQPYLNPGNAWKLREEYWKKYIVDISRGPTMGLIIPRKGMEYSYNERMGPYIVELAHNLMNNPDTRRGILSIWDQQIDGPKIGGKNRVSCSMYYNLQVVDGHLDLIYHMRSSDFYEHFKNDCCLAVLFQEVMAGMTGYKVGKYFMVIDDLHAYRRDWAHLEIY